MTRAVVLVGGFGTRLRPLTFSHPKQMLPIVNRPMIEHVIAHLAVHGVTEAVLSLGYRPDAFVDAYPDGVCAGVQLHYAVEPEPLDTAGAIGFAARSAGITERFLVVNGDVLTDLDITALMEFHAGHGAEGTIALHPVDDPSAFGVVPTEPDGKVIAFVEKPPPGEAPTNLINAGTYVLEPAVLARIASDRKVSIEREVFPAMVADGCLYAMADKSYWIDAGTPAKYLEAQFDLLDGQRETTLSGIDPTARIAADAVVEQSVIGPGVIVEEGAVVRRSAVLAGASIGPEAHVTGSIVGENTMVGERASLSELTVLGADVEVSAGAVLVGERLPENPEP